MKSKTAGIILAIIGILMIIYTGFRYVTTENVIDLGPLQMNMDKSHFVQWSPVIGVVLLVGGIIVIFINKKKNT
ncbi:MAG: LPXTG cell wall anchor domain-containing protein [Bacteroidales bacterium]|nr:LPXTG cell wall anchor domain-containing protein [Bacteroidales bacterium]